MVTVVGRIMVSQRCLNLIHSLEPVNMLADMAKGLGKYKDLEVGPI